MEFLLACIKLTVSRENVTVTEGDVKTGIKSRRTLYMIVRHSTFECIGTDLRSAALHSSVG